MREANLVYCITALRQVYLSVFSFIIVSKRSFVDARSESSLLHNCTSPSLLERFFVLMTFKAKLCGCAERIQAKYGKTVFYLDIRLGLSNSKLMVLSFLRNSKKMLLT